VIRGSLLVGLALAVLACPVPGAAQLDTLANWGVTARGTDSFRFWHNDAAVVGKEDNYGNMLDLVFIKEDTTFGMQFDHANFYPANPEVPTDRINELRKLYFDIVSVTNKPAWAALMAVTTPANMLFGTDIPYMTFETAIGEMGQMGMSQADLRAIECGNAIKLMPTLRSLSAQRGGEGGRSVATAG